VKLRWSWIPASPLAGCSPWVGNNAAKEGCEKIRKKIVSCDSCGGSQSGGGNPCNYPISSKGSGSFIR
jgi:hypothetical protein